MVLAAGPAGRFYTVSLIDCDLKVQAKHSPSPSDHIRPTKLEISTFVFPKEEKEIDSQNHKKHVFPLKDLSHGENTWRISFC